MIGTFEKYWENICKIHFFTKHFILLAEELSLDGTTFFQPLKEHRDAYDHIVRVYAVKMGLKTESDVDNYVRENMSKALGHEYRAFFDAVDWFSIILREKINFLLQGKTNEYIKSCFPDYQKFKEELIELPKKIADLREGKDIGNNMNLSIFDKIESYTTILDSLTDKYIELAKALA